MTTRKREPKIKLAEATSSTSLTPAPAIENAVANWIARDIEPMLCAIKKQSQILQPTLNEAKRYEKLVQPYLQNAAHLLSVAKKAEAALGLARMLEAQHASWVEANNRLYGIAGILTQLFPTPSQRTEFIKTKQSAEIQSILENLPEPKSQLGKPRIDVNGKILIRVPRSLHAALLAEAEAEGVSLNQLILSKLSLQLRAAV